MVIKRVGVWSAAKVTGTLNAAMGLIFGLIVALVSTVGAGIFAAVNTNHSSPFGWFGALFGVGAIVLLPCLYGVMGLVMGAIMAVLYNLLSGIVGGLEIDVE